VRERERKRERERERGIDIEEKGPDKLFLMLHKPAVFAEKVW
jgi:hypothetical protein